MLAKMEESAKMLKWRKVFQPG